MREILTFIELRKKPEKDTCSLVNAQEGKVETKKVKMVGRVSMDLGRLGEGCQIPTAYLQKQGSSSGPGVGAEKVNRVC